MADVEKENEQNMSLSEIAARGIQLPTNPNPIQTLEKPSWWDCDRFNNGRLFFFTYLPNICLTWYCALLTGLSIERFARVLVCTGQSHDARGSAARYRDTLRHLLTWHVSDVWRRDGAGHSSVRRVCHMHDGARDKMAQCDRHGQPLAGVAVSQYDMCVVQSAFIYGVVLYSRDIGIYTSRERILDYIYYWRCIGYLLGIDDELNVCRPSYPHTVSLCREVRDTVLRPALAHPTDEYKTLLSAFLEGWRFPPWLTSTLINYCHRQLDIDPSGGMSLCEYIQLYILNIILCLILPLLLRSRYVMKKIYTHVATRVIKLDKSLLSEGLTIIDTGRISQ